MQRAKQVRETVSAQVVPGQFAVHILEELMAKSEGRLGQTPTQRRVEGSAKSKGEAGH